VLDLSDDLPNNVPSRCLVVTDGGGPTVKQRRDLDARLQRAAELRTAVITESAATRAMLAAVAWLSRNQIKCFRAAELNKAFDYLGLDAKGQQLMREAIRRASEKMGLAIFGEKASRLSA
jgi:hypothetical protein